MRPFNFSSGETIADRYLREAAWHEAGHAVLSIYFGVVPSLAAVGEKLAADAGVDGNGFIYTDTGALGDNLLPVLLAGDHARNLSLSLVDRRPTTLVVEAVERLRLNGSEADDLSRALTIIASRQGAEAMSDDDIERAIAEILRGDPEMSDAVAAAKLRARYFEIGLSSPDAPLIAAYRQAEDETITLIWRREITAAIKAVAGRLIEGPMFGGELVALANPYLERPCV